VAGVVVAGQVDRFLVEGAGHQGGDAAGQGVADRGGHVLERRLAGAGGEDPRRVVPRRPDHAALNVIDHPGAGQGVFGASRRVEGEIQAGHGQRVFQDAAVGIDHRREAGQAALAAGQPIKDFDDDLRADAGGVAGADA